MAQSPQSDDRSARARGIGCLAMAAFAALLSLVATAFVFLHWRSADPDAQKHAAVGQKLPQLNLQPLTGGGEPVSLTDLTDRVVLLNFWGTWCPPCLAELPDVARIHREFRDRDDFAFLAVSCGQTVPEDLPQLRLETTALLFAQQISIPTYADPQAVTRRAVHPLVAMDRYPTTLVIDRGGVIRGVWVGPLDRDEAEELIRRLLKKG